MYFDVVGICMGVSIHNKDSFMIMNKRMLFFAPLIRRWINSSFFWTWQSQALLSYERAGQTESISDEGMFTSFKLPFENTQITSLFGICGVIISFHLVRRGRSSWAWSDPQHKEENALHGNASLGSA